MWYQIYTYWITLQYKFIVGQALLQHGISIMLQERLLQCLWYFSISYPFLHYVQQDKRCLIQHEVKSCLVSYLLQYQIL